MSYSVKQVEDYYGLQIFNRQTYRPELTAEGKVLITQIRRLLRQANEFESFVSEMKGDNETEIRLGVSSIFPIEKITDLLITLKKEFPRTTVHLEIEVASGERMLLEEKVDIGIYGTPSRHKLIDHKQIDTLNIPLVISDKLPLKNSAHVTEADLASYPQIIIKSTDRQSPDTNIVDDAAKWYVTDQYTKKSLITSGLGWGRMPIHLVEKELKDKSLISLDTQGELNLPIYIAKLKNKVQGPVAQRIWSHFL